MTERRGVLRKRIRLLRGIGERNLPAIGIPSSFSASVARIPAKQYERYDTAPINGGAILSPALRGVSAVCCADFFDLTGVIRRFVNGPAATKAEA